MTTIIAPDSNLFPLHNDHEQLLEIDGKRYKSVTHFIYTKMMPDKILANGMIKQINGLTVRKKATAYLFGKKVGDDRKLAQASEYIIMKALEEGYRAAFSQPALRNKLLGTGNEGIVYVRDEPTFLPGDITVLGVNRSENGQNKMGLLLERIRDDIRKEIISREKPDSQLHEIDRLYFTWLRHKILNERLSLGHFPSDYSLKGLYMSLKNVSEENFHSVFLGEHPGVTRIGFWNLYQGGEKMHAGVFEPEVIEEFKSGNDEWIEKAYELAVKKKCLLIEYLKFLKIDYYTLLVSIAKEKVLNNYYVRRFEISKDGSSKELSLKEYLSKFEITIDTIHYIGEESLKDLREIVYKKYTSGVFIGIPDFEENLASSIEGLRGIISQSIKFPKFVPYIEQPSEKFVELVSMNVPLEPLSPQRTYGGIDIVSYYSPTHPDGACSDNAEQLCPIPGLPTATLPAISPHGPLFPMYPRISPSGNSDDESDDDNLDGEDYAYSSGDDDDDGDDYDDDEYKPAKTAKTAKTAKDEMDENLDDEDEFEYDDKKEEEEREEREEREYQKYNEDIIGDDQDLEKAIKANIGKAFVPMRKYVPPVISARFSSEKDYPYEWLSPFYITHIRIYGMYYPSIAHYVVAKLATPLQFRNASIREWIQKGKEPFDPMKKDPYVSPKDYRNIYDLVKALPVRMKEIYDLLYLRYANRAYEAKFGRYPFRQLLCQTKNTKLIYLDESNQQAVAGKEIVKLLTEIRSKIKCTVQSTPIPNPAYDKTNLVMFDYIRDRTEELLRATILFARYRLSPRENYVVSDLAYIGFNDAFTALKKIYSDCQDIDFNEVVEDPPEKYIVDFDNSFRKLCELYFPGKDIFDSMHPDVMDTLNQISTGFAEVNNSQLFVNFSQIRELIWKHIVYVSRFLEEGLQKDYEESVLQQRIKKLRVDLYSLPLGSSKKVATDAVCNIIQSIHTYFPQQTQMGDSEVNFIEDFVYPLSGTRTDTTAPIEENEGYEMYPQLVEKITHIFGGAEQNISAIKKLSHVLNGIINVKSSSNGGSNDILFNKMTIRLKFFAIKNNND